jgi:1,4-dihydroxy-6-naphthoate synthase
MEKRVDLRGIDFDIRLLDIQQLNEGLFHGQFDVAKASFHAAALLADRTTVLPSGSALGFGVGPLLLASREGTHPELNPGLTLCPGQHTTATLLFRMFYGPHSQIKQVLFSDIMPTLKSHGADFGVCIHEGRFTWKQQGLALVEDLGTRWERLTSLPLPLGGILASRSLAGDLISRVQDVIRDSIVYGLAHRDATLPTMRKYAQELDDEVLFQHVDLYVNDWTVDLGQQGSQALKLLSDKARSAGAVPSDAHDIEVWHR